ncbi:MAG: hypothetical protein A3F10_07545 [Coxiella sp. RIFCSPHIGHO2_12_FULL_42_15]|nr:MAG: hypothetical protein A3F10_07545 [Coxiella sp. RIFCSPHIGHO2_12_FULL_42_15]
MTTLQRIPIFIIILILMFNMKPIIPKVFVSQEFNNSVDSDNENQYIKPQRLCFQYVKLKVIGFEKTLILSNY